MAQYTNPASPDALYDAERELDELTSAITGRRAFSYNPNADPMPPYLAVYVWKRTA